MSDNNKVIYKCPKCSKFSLGTGSWLQSICCKFMFADIIICPAKSPIPSLALPTGIEGFPHIAH